MKKLFAAVLALSLSSSPAFAAGTSGPMFIDLGAMGGRGGPAQAGVWREPLAGLSRLLNTPALNMTQRLGPEILNSPFYHLLQGFDTLPPQVQVLHIYSMAPMLAELPQGYLHDLSQQVEQLSTQKAGSPAGQQNPAGAEAQSAPADPGQEVLAMVGSFATAYTASLPKVKERLAAMSRISGQLQDDDLADVSSMIAEAGYRERIYGQALQEDFTRVNGELKAKYRRGVAAMITRTAQNLAGKRGDPQAPAGEAAQAAAQPSAPLLSKAAAAPPPASELVAAVKGGLLAIGELLVDATPEAGAKPQLAALVQDTQEVLSHWGAAYQMLAHTLVDQSPDAQRKLKTRLERATNALNEAFPAFLENPAGPGLARKFRAAAEAYFNALNDIVPAADLESAEARENLNRVAVVAAGVQADLRELRQSAAAQGLPKNDSLGQLLAPPQGGRIEDRDLARVKAGLGVLRDATGRLAEINLALNARMKDAPKPEAAEGEEMGVELPAELMPAARGAAIFLNRLQKLDQDMLTIISANVGYTPLAQRRELQAAFNGIFSAETVAEARAANARLGQILELMAERMEPLSQSGRDALTTALMKLTGNLEGLKAVYAEAAKAGLIPEAEPAGLALAAEPGTPITEADWALLKEIFRNLALASVQLPELSAAVEQIAEGVDPQTQTLPAVEGAIALAFSRIDRQLMARMGQLYLEAFLLGAPPAARGQAFTAIADFTRRVGEAKDLEALLASFEGSYEAFRTALAAAVPGLNAEQRQLLPQTANALTVARVELEELRQALVTTGLWLMDSPSVQGPAMDMTAILQQLLSRMQPGEGEQPQG